MKDKQMGRPPLREESRNIPVTIRLTEKEYDAVKTYQKDYEKNYGKKITVADMVLKFLENS